MTEHLRASDEWGSSHENQMRNEMPDSKIRYVEPSRSFNTVVRRV